MSRHVKAVICSIILAALVGFSAKPVHAEDPDEQEVMRWGGREFARLEMFVGHWRVTETHFDAKGEARATVKGAEKIEWMLDHHAIRREYNTGPDAAMFRAFGILTWNAATGMYEGVWFDNCSTNGPTQTKGEWRDNDSTMTFTVEARSADGSPVHYKVVERFIEDKQRVATTYSIHGSELVKWLEVKYERAPACPSRLRVVDELHRPRREERKDD